ncbi:MAG TPA: carboxymuconolactone decarboxylase family protein [Pseudoalteromonas prydzensis]|uniref:Carboxymuconolactone decarboxylase family protein n=3 Tax=root TaxID=1 RepID=A0A7V1GFW4_9GAMM|nr:carboxymuconolactone decarboxylase family protein [Pseudoalteromonas prydzensis]
MNSSLNQLVQPVERKNTPELEPIYQSIEDNLGFIPNGMLTMAKNPMLASAFGQLFACLNQLKHIETELKWAIATISSNAAGCQYCQGHFSHIASRVNVNRAKVLAAFEFATSDWYSEAEKAALRFAFATSTSPAHLEQQHYDELGVYFTEPAVIEIAAIIAICGFLNRWNTAMDSQLETDPAAILEEINHLTQFA